MPTFLFDENFSPQLVDVLATSNAPGTFKHARAAGISGMNDADWLARMPELGWIVISSDRNERTRGLTAQDMANAGITYLMVGSFFDHLRVWDRTKWLVARWDKVYSQASKLAPGSVMLIHKSGQVIPVASAFKE